MVNSVNFQQSVSSNMVLFDYSGSYSNDLFHGILELTEEKLNETETSTKTRKKVYSILVEVFQNLFHHYYNELGKEFSDQHEVRLTIRKDGEVYCISAGNPVSCAKVESLRNRIEQLNTLSRNEIRELYRKQLSEGDFNEKGGAGLGMIDIVRKSGEKINYNFKSVNQNFSFFQLEVKVSA